MGNYTSLVGAVKIKAEYKNLVTHFANYMYDELKRDEEKYLFVKEFFKTERSSWIPNRNPLCTFFDDKFFNNRLENCVWYFSSNLKDYEDENTGFTPIDAFFVYILQNIAEEILVLETCSDIYYCIHQYNFSDNGKIEQVNQIDLEQNTIPSYGHIPLDEDDEIVDVFKEFKQKYNLSVYCNIS